MWHKLQFVTVLLVVFLSIQYVVQAREIGHDPYLLPSVVGNDIQPNALEKKDEYKHSIQKRWAFTAAQVGAKVLFGLSVLATAGNIIFDIILKIKGCESIYPSIATDQQTFNDSKNQIMESSANIDAVWGQSQEILGFLQPTALVTQEISNKLDQIADDMDSIADVFTPIDSTPIIKLNGELETQIKAKNQTVLDWTYTELDQAYEALYETELGRLQLATSVFQHVARFSDVIWYKMAGKHFRVKAMTKFLDTQAGAKLKIYSRTKPNLISKFGGPDFNTIIKNTAAAKVEADWQQKRYEARFNKWKLAGSYFMSGLTIASEVWMALIKIDQCEDIRDEVRASKEEIEPEAENMVALLDTCKEHLENLTAIWEDDVRGPILNEDITTLLQEIKGMVENASTTSEDLVAASTAIGNFLDNGQAATGLTEFYELQDALLAGLHKVHFSLSCYYDKFNVLRNVAESCKAGHGQLDEIMVTKVNDFDAHRNECLSDAGLQYLTIDSIATFIAGDSVLMGYSEDCLLNNKEILNLVCAKVCDSEPVAVIAANASITVEYAEKFIELCPPLCSLSTNDKKFICNFKSYGATLQSLLDGAFSQFDPAQVEQAYNNCPSRDAESKLKRRRKLTREALE